MTQRSDIERVFREGKPRRTRSLIVRLCASPLSHPRVGIVVPRHGQTAVARNQLKRRLRELVRIDLLHHLQCVDLILFATKDAYHRSMDDLHSEIGRVATMEAVARAK